MAHTRVRPIFLLVLLVCLGAGLLIADSGANHQLKQAFPISLGTSGGNVNDISRAFCCSGTLGSLVTKGGTNYILSNNHVLARVDQAVVGENISQPGLVDVGCQVSKTNTVAHFSQAAPLGSSNVDAALAAVVSGDVTSTGNILDVGVPASTTATPTVGRGVAKSGRTTGLTCSTIGSVNTNVSVQYQKGCNSGKKFVITYTNQVVINSSSFSAGGDSGSLIVTSGTAQPAALLFAGSSTTTIGNPIQDVTANLGVNFVGGATHSVNCTGAAGATSASSGPQGASLPDREVDRATAVKNQYASGLMSDPAVQGVGVGAHPQNPGEAVLVVYLETGRALARPIPSQIDGVRTVVVRTDRFRAFGWNEKQQERRSCSAR